MQLEIPDAREDGDFAVHLNPGSGDPFGHIELTKDGRVRLRWLREDDCDRLIRAAADLKDKLIKSRNAAGFPHSARLYEGHCQLCGKPEDDELHAEPERELPKAYVRPCTDAGPHEPCDGITGLCDCPCHVFAASVMIEAGQ